MHSGGLTALYTENSVITIATQIIMKLFYNSTSMLNMHIVTCKTRVVGRKKQCIIVFLLKTHQNGVSVMLRQYFRLYQKNSDPSVLMIIEVIQLFE